MTGQGRAGIAIRPRVIAAGVVFVAVPSVFGIFPEMTDWPLWVRAAITAIWIGTVLGTIVFSSRRDSDLEKVVATAVRQREQLRLRATDDVLWAMLGERKTGLPASYRFTVYVFDPGSDLLLPVSQSPSMAPMTSGPSPPAAEPPETPTDGRR